MITFKNLFIFLSSVGLLGCSLAIATDGPLQFSLKPAVIQPGARATFEVRLALDKKAMQMLADRGSAAAEIHDEMLTQLKSIQILNKDFKTDGNGEFVWQYEITAYKVGKIKIPPVEVQYGPFSLSSESRSLEISTERVEGDTAIREEFDRVRAPINWPKLLKWVFFSVLGGIGLASLLAFVPKPQWRRRQKIRVDASPAPETDTVWLRRRLNELKLQLDQTSPPDTVVDELTLILKEYLGRKNKVPGRMWTTEEFARFYTGDSATMAMVSVFRACDQFKFANEKKNSPKQNALLFLGEAERVLAQIIL